LGADLGFASQRLHEDQRRGGGASGHPGGKVGLLASFNVVRFDEVVIATPRSN
jgi:hypothetical protein